MKLPRVDYFYDEARKFLTRSWLDRCAENHGIYLYSLSTFQGVHAPRSIFYHLNREPHPLHLFRPQTRWKLKNETEKFKHEENIFKNPEYITFRCNFKIFLTKLCFDRDIENFSIPPEEVFNVTWSDSFWESTHPHWLPVLSHLCKLLN